MTKRKDATTFGDVYTEKKQSDDLTVNYNANSKTTLNKKSTYQCTIRKIYRD
jgi:hypothetical protein